MNSTAYEWQKFSGKSIRVNKHAERSTARRASITWLWCVYRARWVPVAQHLTTLRSLSVKWKHTVRRCISIEFQSVINKTKWNNMHASYWIGYVLASIRVVKCQEMFRTSNAILTWRKNQKVLQTVFNVRERRISAYPSCGNPRIRLLRVTAGSNFVMYTIFKFRNHDKEACKHEPNRSISRLPCHIFWHWPANKIPNITQ